MIRWVGTSPCMPPIKEKYLACKEYFRRCFSTLTTYLFQSVATSFATPKLDEFLGWKRLIKMNDGSILQRSAVSLRRLFGQANALDYWRPCLLKGSQVTISYFVHGDVRGAICLSFLLVLMLPSSILLADGRQAGLTVSDRSYTPVSAEPTILPSHLWVSPEGDDDHDGSRHAPLATIQEAAIRAVPGTAVLVREGDYHENVKIPHGGSASAPIWFVSVDGPAKANIIPPNENVATILGRGTDHIIIKDFAIDGADNRSGIEFTQAGIDFSNLVANIVIIGNTIYDAGIDGIKIAQTESIDIIGNHISGGREEGIDFVTVWNATIAQNEVRHTEGPGAIAVKGGSNNILIKQNYVHDVGVDGILVGGWTDADLFQLFDGYEAKNITVQDNYVQDVGKRPLNFLAAQDSVATNNFLDPNNDYFTIVNIEGDNIGFVSKNLTITDNVVTKDNWLYITPGHDIGHKIANNKIGDVGLNQVGLKTYQHANPDWLNKINNENGFH